MLTFFFKYYEKFFSIKLFYFPMFGSIFKWVEKQSPNFLTSFIQIDVKYSCFPKKKKNSNKNL